MLAHALARPHWKSRAPRWGRLTPAPVVRTAVLFRSVSSHIQERRWKENDPLSLFLGLLSGSHGNGQGRAPSLETGRRLADAIPIKRAGVGCAELGEQAPPRLFSEMYWRQVSPVLDF